MRRCACAKPLLERQGMLPADDSSILPKIGALSDGSVSRVKIGMRRSEQIDGSSLEARSPAELPLMALAFYQRIRLARSPGAG